MSTVCVIQHIGCETPGIITDAFTEAGISTRPVRAFEGDRVPENIGGASGVVIMGGPMGVYEQKRYPFLREEVRLIEQTIKAQRPILGVCLGSQLLATALGARVTKGKKKEIGWYPVRLSDAALVDPLWKGVERSFTAYHWHGDVFELPAGAEPLASSALTACQAFRYGKNAYGFLFHMEVTGKIIGEMVRTFTEELQEENIDGPQIVERAGDYLPRLQSIGKLVFGRWVALLKAST